MILCARRDHVNRARNADHTESMRKVCTFYDCKIYYHGRHIFLLEIYEVRKGLWALFFCLCVSDADWLGKQTLIT